MILPLILGAVTGLALGFTGGGGTMLALPLLMYGLGMPAHAAAVSSLVAVGAMALVGALARMRAHQLQVHLGVIFAVAGIAGAPLGAWLATLVPGSVIIGGFIVLTLLVAQRMWRRAYGSLPTDSQPLPDQALLRHAVCRFDPTGRLRLTSQCLRLLVPAGLLTGVISGMFGVGGGFVVVPALVLISGIDIRQATATSLLVVALVAGSGAVSAIVVGQPVDLLLTSLFTGGGIVGLEVGSHLGSRLPARSVQRSFAVILVIVAGAMLTKSFISGVTT